MNSLASAHERTAALWNTHDLDGDRCVTLTYMRNAHRWKIARHYPPARALDEDSVFLR